MKRLIALFFLFIILLSLPASADVIFIPENSDFYYTHRNDCTRLQRNYYTNGTKGYIAIYDQPNGKRTDYIENGNRLHILCTLSVNDTDWGMATVLNSNTLEKETWVSMKELYLIYDGRSFREDFADEIKKEQGAIEGGEKRDVYCYDYPGAPDPYRYNARPEAPITYTETYTDPSGRLWGYVSYHMGIRDSWICVDKISVIQAPFGGDPALLQKEEAFPLPQALTPSKDPPPFTLDPLVLIAIALVLAAILAALILLKFCYRNKKDKSDPSDMP